MKMPPTSPTQKMPDVPEEDRQNPAGHTPEASLHHIQELLDALHPLLRESQGAITAIHSLLLETNDPLTTLTLSLSLLVSLQRTLRLAVDFVPLLVGLTLLYFSQLWYLLHPNIL